MENNRLVSIAAILGIGTITLAALAGGVFFFPLVIAGALIIAGIVFFANYHLLVINKMRSTIEVPNLANTDLTEANCQNKRFHRSFLWGIRLRKALCRDADFEEAVLTEADLSYTNAQRANFKKAKMRGTNLFNTDFADAKLEGAQLQNSVVIGSNLEGANLRKANLAGAVFKQCEIHRTSWNGARFSKNTVLPFSYSEAIRRGMVPVAS